MPGRPASRVPRLRVGRWTRLRAWWLGVDNAELLARYGAGDGFLRSLWTEWRGSAVVLAGVFCLIVGRLQVNQANAVLDNIELNRHRFYRKDFSPGYASGAPRAIYDGPKGYSYRDETSGLMTNADKQIVSDETREQRRVRLSEAVVSDEMVRDAKALRNSVRYRD